MGSLATLGHVIGNERLSSRGADSQDGEAEVERLIKQADELKAEKQRLMSEVIQTQRQVSCSTLTHSKLVNLPT